MRASSGPSQWGRNCGTGEISSSKMVSRFAKTATALELRISHRGDAACQQNQTTAADRISSQSERHGESCSRFAKKHEIGHAPHMKSMAWLPSAWPVFANRRFKASSEEVHEADRAAQRTESEGQSRWSKSENGGFSAAGGSVCETEERTGNYRACRQLEGSRSPIVFVSG
jgi:hypothetical protein